MITTLEGAFKQLKKEAFGQIVTKAGFQLGERVVAYVGFFTIHNKEGRIDETSHAMVMRFDNSREDLKEWHYCEICEERYGGSISPKDIADWIEGNLQYDYKNLK